MRITCIAIFAGLMFCVAGCQTAKPKQESSKETISALGAVTEGLTNQNLTDKDLKNLAVQVQKDPKAQSAVKSINQALSVEQTGIKYCPKDGKRFSSRVTYCPDDGTLLKDVE